MAGRKRAIKQNVLHFFGGRALQELTYQSIYLLRYNAAVPKEGIEPSFPEGTRF